MNTRVNDFGCAKRNAQLLKYFMFFKRIIFRHQVRLNLFFLSLILFSGQITYGQDETRPNEPGPWPSIEVNTYTGNLYYQRNDLYIPARGDNDLELTFTYNSLKCLKDEGFGKGWSFSFGMYYTYQEDEFTVFRPDGQEDVFTWDGTSFVPPVGVCERVLLLEGSQGSTRTLSPDTVHCARIKA